MLKICCVYFKGFYTPDYVSRLYRSLKKNSSIPFEFVCLSDPIGDMIARIKNATTRSYKKVEIPSSSFKTKIVDILKNEGFIKDFQVNNDKNRPILSRLSES